MESIVYAALISGRYGYSESAKDYHVRFQVLTKELGIEYECIDINTHLGVQRLFGTDWTGKHLVLHKMPGQFTKEQLAHLKKSKSLTYMTVWECTQIPATWMLELSEANMIVTFSKFSASGIINTFNKRETKLPVIKIIPHFLREFSPDIVEDFQALIDDRNNLLFTASQMTERKGIDLLVKSFWSLEGKYADNIRLIIKGPAGTQNYCNAALPKNERPEIVVIEDYLTNPQMDYLMSICPFFISTARGEGFGLDVVRAGAAGIHTYSTADSGPDTWFDGIPSKPHYHRIPSALEPVVSVSTYHFANTKGMNWPVSRLSDIMTTLEEISKTDKSKFDIEIANKNIREFNEMTNNNVRDLLNDIIKQ